MSNLLTANLWRFLGILAAQVLVFKQASEAIGPYFNIILYPLFLLLLPMVLPTAAVILIGFLIGILVDFFYATPGVHAGASVFAAFCRPIILAAFEPKGGYSGKDPIPTPHHVGWQNFFQIAGVFYFLHLFWYFAMTEFTLVYFGSILLRTIASLLISMLLLVIYMGLFRTKT
jgi:hypothetical protein